MIKSVIKIIATVMLGALFVMPAEMQYLNYHPYCSFDRVAFYAPMIIIGLLVWKR